MKALLLKDLALLTYRKQNLYIIIFASIFMCLVNDGAYALTYLSSLYILLAISTISYDELDNGQMYMFCWPIDRKEYVMSKYVLTFVLSLIGILTATIFLLIFANFNFSTININRIVPSLIITLLVNALIISFSIPMQLKFGSDKSRILTLLFFGILLGTMFFFFSDEQMNIILSKIVSFVTSTNPVILIIVGLVFIALLIYLSIKISEKVMKNKKY